MALNELAAQRQVVEAVRTHGGFGFKLSHRFLAGIPDLFLKPKDREPSIWEVKIRDCPSYYEPFKLHLTPLQQAFLRDYHAAGGRCGVISFLRGPVDLMIAVMSYKLVSYGDSFIRPWYVPRTAHTTVERGNRYDRIYEIFMKGAYSEC